MRETLCHWTVETLADAMNGVDAVNLKELVDGIRENPAGVIEAVRGKLEQELERRIEMHNLCPECCWPGKRAKQIRCYSNGWSEPAGSWDEPGGEFCEWCGWEE